MLYTKVFYLFSFLLMSCMPVTQQKEKNKDFTIISAEKSSWFGGRAGVKGENYYFTLRNNQQESFQFTNLKIGETNFPVKTKINSDGIFLTAQVSLPYQEPTINVETGKMEEKAVADKKKVVLEYSLANSKMKQGIEVKNIKEKNSPISGEALPN